jgi:hypothetical protein
MKTYITTNIYLPNTNNDDTNNDDTNNGDTTTVDEDIKTGLNDLNTTPNVVNLNRVLKLYASDGFKKHKADNEKRMNDAKIVNRMAALGTSALSGSTALGTSVLASARSRLSNISIPNITGNVKSAVVVHRPAFVKISDTHSKYMVLVLNTLAAIDELRAPGWLENIRATLGSVTSMFDEGSSMNSFISAISYYDETKNKYRASMYAEVNLLRNDDRMNGQPKCTDAPIDVNIMVEQNGLGIITRVDSALNTIMHGLEEKPEITTNPVGLEAGYNPADKPGRNLVVKNFKEDAFDHQVKAKMVGGRKTKRSLSTHKKRQNKTYRAGLRSQFGIK